MRDQVGLDHLRHGSVAMSLLIYLTQEFRNYAVFRHLLSPIKNKSGDHMHIQDEALNQRPRLPG